MIPTEKAQKAYTKWRQEMLKGSDTDLVIPAWNNTTPLMRRSWIAAIKELGNA